MSDQEYLSPAISRPATEIAQGRVERAVPRANAAAIRLFVLARRYPAAAAGCAFLILLAFAAIAAPLIAPHKPDELVAVGPFALPSAKAWLGTDQLSRDLFSRLVFGARGSLTIAAVATLSGVLVGGAIGTISGYAGGRADIVLQRAMDVLDAFPALILAILLVSLLGPSKVNVTIAISVVLIPGTNRVARSVTLTQRSLPYIESARAIGARPARIVFRHIAPSLAIPMVIIGTTSLGGTIMAEASLSFLGLGPPPPAPTWGSMLNGTVRQYFITEPWLAIVPGAALSLTILSATLIGDALRDALDPRLRRQKH